MTTITVDFDELHQLITGQEIDTHENTRGIAAFHEAVADDPAFETVISRSVTGLQSVTSSRKRLIIASDIDL